MRWTPPIPILLALALGLGEARAQDVDAQQRWLIEVHSLLHDLPPLQAPAALASGRLDAGLELVTVPHIDGRVGERQELTASDHSRLFPRPRLALGLPAPRGFRTFVGLSYVPPIRFRQVTTDYAALEGGIGVTPGRLRLGIRIHGLYASSRAPVTDPATRDVLRTWGAGADAAAGVRLGGEALAVEPYAGAGVAAVRGRFRVTADGTVLHGQWTGATLQLGLRLSVHSRWEVVTEVDAYPGRLVHTDVRVGYLFGK